MAKLTIEIDTGAMEKVENSGREDLVKDRDVRTIQNLVEIMYEAVKRLERMGRNANGVKLYNRSREVGEIVLEESARPTRNRAGCREKVCVCHDPAVARFRLVCNHCGCRDE